MSGPWKRKADALCGSSSAPGPVAKLKLRTSSCGTWAGTPGTAMLASLIISSGAERFAIGADNSSIVSSVDHLVRRRGRDDDIKALGSPPIRVRHGDEMTENCSDSAPRLSYK